jgi:chemotaxis regulatin CheY-phosphate phosphatase CheZ
MHHEPDLKRVLDRIRQHLDELGRTAGNIFLTAADTDARTQSGKLREVAIAADAEDLTRQLAREVAGAAK